MAEAFEFPVDRSSILLFAGALDETNPLLPRRGGA
jgi:hypothetical protein